MGCLAIHRGLLVIAGLLHSVVGNLGGSSVPGAWIALLIFRPSGDKRPLAVASGSELADDPLFVVLFSLLFLAGGLWSFLRPRQVQALGIRYMNWARRTMGSNWREESFQYAHSPEFVPLTRFFGGLLVLVSGLFLAWIGFYGNW